LIEAKCRASKEASYSALSVNDVLQDRDLTARAAE
jgi:hypothetical protein